VLNLGLLFNIYKAHVYSMQKMFKISSDSFHTCNEMASLLSDRS